MLGEVIELLEKEIERIEELVVNLYERKLPVRESYRAMEVKRFQRILDLLEAEASIELDWRESR